MNLVSPTRSHSLRPSSKPTLAARLVSMPPPASCCLHNAQEIATTACMRASQHANDTLIILANETCSVLLSFATVRVNILGIPSGGGPRHNR